MGREFTDDELMKRVAQGNEEAFRHLFRRHGGKLISYARQLLGGDLMKAEDLVQNFWIKALKLAPHYEGRGQFTAWACTLLRNSCLNELRSQRRLLPLQGDVDESADPHGLEEELLQKTALAQVMKHIEALPDQQRTALVMFLSEDVSYQEIARELETTESSVKSLIFRARQNLMRGLAS